MSDERNLDQLRGNVLQRIARNERNFKLALAGAVAWELFVLLAFLLGSYTVVVLGLVALGVYLNGGNLRVLKAIELLKNELTAKSDKG